MTLFLNSVMLMINVITVGFQHNVHMLKGETANAMDQEPTWEMCARAQRIHAHTGQITDCLIHLHNKVIALLDTSDEIWVRFCTAPAYVSWQLLARLCALHTSCYQSAAPMERPLPLQGSGTACSVLSCRNPNPQEPGYVHL